MQINVQNKTVNNVWSMLLVLIVCVALYSLVFTLKVLGDDSAFSMWALGAVLVWCNFKEILNSIRRKRTQEIFAFVVLTISAVVACFQCRNFSILLISIAMALFFGGFRVVLLTIVPFAIWAFVIPNYAQIHLFVSYPMRILETKIVEVILNCISYDISVAGTSIFVDGKEIIITTACSGVEHIWTLILLGWIASTIFFQDNLVKGLYFALIVPLFIFFNAVRVVLTIICTHNWGDSFLTGTPHLIFGISTIVATMLVYVCIGIFFSKIGIDSTKQ